MKPLVRIWKVVTTLLGIVAVCLGIMILMDITNDGPKGTFGGDPQTLSQTAIWWFVPILISAIAIFLGGKYALPAAIKRFDGGPELLQELWETEGID